MKRARYRGDVTDQFRVGQILGRTTAGDYVRITAIAYNPNTDQTTVTGEHTPPAAPEGMRLRYHGERDQ